MALKAQASEHKRQMTIVPEAEKEEHLHGFSWKKKRVAAYARVSTEQDAQQNSYEAQIEYYTDYIKSKPEWVFVGIYSDEGITGTSYKRRDGFNQMLADAKDGKIDLILTKSISRFSRNTVDSLSVTRELKARGVEVYFEKENISSMDVQAELIFTIMSSVAQEESRSISENVRWGVKRSMEAGKVNLPWNSFLGYEKGPDGLPKIVEEEAKIVRRIYQTYLKGKSFKGIAEELTADGIKSPRGYETWSTSTVQSILQNEKYKGDARLQKTYTVDFLTKEKRKNNGELKSYYIKDSHDPIVSEETFELVQQEIKRRTQRGGKFHDSPFSNKVRCGDCGDYYGHRVTHSAVPKYRKEVWYCNKKYKGKGAENCSTPVITEKQMEDAFLVAFNQLTTVNVPDVDLYEKKFLPIIGRTDSLNNDLIEEHTKLEALWQPPITSDIRLRRPIFRA